jgi:hypothetical protein
MNNFETKEIEITSVYLSKNYDQVRFQSYPRRLTYKGREYVLADA